MDWTALIVELIGGVVGGLGLGQVAKNMSLGRAGDVIAGAVGGVGGGWLATLVPALAAMLTGGGTAIVGQGVTGIVGGAILTAIAGAIKKATVKA